MNITIIEPEGAIKQYDLLPEEARDLEREGVIDPCGECSDTDTRGYHISDDFIAEHGDDCDADVRVWAVLELKLKELGYRKNGDHDH